MSDWTPEDVDALFQEGSKGYEFEYHEAAWGQMENLLERRDRRRRLIWWLIGATLSLLFIVFAYTIWVDVNSRHNVSDVDKLESNHLKSELNQVDKEIKAPIKETIPPLEKKPIKANRDTKTTPIAKVQSEQPLKKEASISSEKSNIPIKTIEKNNVTANELAKVENEQLPINPTETEALDVQLIDLNQATEQKKAIITDDLKVIQLSTTEEPLTTTLFDELKDSDIDQKQIPFNSRTALTTEVATLPSLPLQINYTTAPIDFPKSKLEDLAKVQKQISEPPLISPNHFVIGLLLSEEFSFVDRTNMTNLKWKAGLSVEYRFGGKHALKLGINYSQKDYMTSTIENYQVEDGFWHKATAPNTASAICDVLELSWTESYFMKGHEKRGFFINGGLTSYFLLREQYDYTYDTNDPELLWSWGENNTNRHWFGIGEVSVGYNLPFTNKSSLQIAPYAQIPLTGVGHGALKIFSSGVLIRYNFHLK